MFCMLVLLVWHPGNWRTKTSAVCRALYGDVGQTLSLAFKNGSDEPLTNPVVRSKAGDHLNRNAFVCSISVATAVLMKQHSILMDEALARIREKRPIMSPNPGFIEQLKQYEKMLQEERASGKKLEATSY